MSITWEGKVMCNILTVCRYELKMLGRNIGIWLVLALALIMSVLDNAPVAGNLQRLENLNDQSYVVFRILLQEAPILLFGLSFILAGRVIRDKRKGITQLMMPTPLSKNQLVLGNFGGNFLIMLSMMALLLGINAAIHAALNFTCFELLPYLKGLVVVGMPVCLFVAACCTAIPIYIDIRIFHILFSSYLLLNFFNQLSAYGNPVYLLFGELVHAIFVYPGWSADSSAMTANLIFLLSVSLFGILLMLLPNRRLWREA
jgi:hypothetical protein